MYKIISKNKNFPFYLIFLIVTFLVVSWFSGKKLLATGEEGLLFYKPERILEIYKYAWYETGTGYPIPVILPRVPYLAIAALLDSYLPNWIVQAFVFCLLISMGVMGMYLLSYKFFKNGFVSIVSGLFYFFNLFSESQIWNRFITSGMFAWSYLPVFLLLFLTWIKTGEKKWLIIFSISCLFFSNTFGQPAYIITLWTTAIVFFIFIILEERKKPERLNKIKRFIIYFIVWIFLNIWWIYPYIILGQSSFSEIVGSGENFGSLKGASIYFPTSEIVLLKQKFLFGQTSHWYEFYSNHFIYLVSVLVFLVSVLGIIKSRGNYYWKIFITLFVIGWFVSKGSNLPLGDLFFKFLFNNFPFTASLRNPYEKFGLVFLIPYSLFFGLGVFWLSKVVWSRFSKLIVYTTLFLSLVVLVLPMWTAQIFSKEIRVKVPESYEQANEFMSNKSSGRRLLILPIIPGDGVKYTWGYGGLEASEFIFDRPAVSKVLRTKYFDEKYWQLYHAFYNNGNYSQILEEMNIKYLVLHNDLISEVSGASTSAETRLVLSKNSKMQIVKNFGELEIYEFIGSSNSGLFTVEGEKTPNLDYEKINTTHYVLNIKNAKEPYTFIFKETFNDLWEARINDEKIEDHFLVFGYANAWKIEKVGDYTIDLVFKVWPWE